MSKTITVNVKRDVEKKFRKLALTTYGKHKGFLGKAVTEAMIYWAEKQEKDVNARALEMLKKGFNLGGLKTKDRSEWHER